MKKILITFFTVLFCLTSSVGYPQNIICEKTGYTCPEIDIKDLVKRNDIFYNKFSDVPFTGKIIGEEKGKLKNGKKDGTWIKYWDNGQLNQKGDFKNGKKDGAWIGYWDNGQLMYKGYYKNGKGDGSWVGYKQDGTVWKDFTGTFKNGKKISE